MRKLIVLMNHISQSLTLYSKIKYSCSPRAGKGMKLVCGGLRAAPSAERSGLDRVALGHGSARLRRHIRGMRQMSRIGRMGGEDRTGGAYRTDRTEKTN